jgi:transcription antitermination factor NusA-like protein
VSTSVIVNVQEFEFPEVSSTKIEITCVVDMPDNIDPDAMD